MLNLYNKANTNIMYGSLLSCFIHILLSIIQEFPSFVILVILLLYVFASLTMVALTFFFLSVPQSKCITFSIGTSIYACSTIVSIYQRIVFLYWIHENNTTFYLTFNLSLNFFDFYALLDSLNILKDLLLNKFARIFICNNHLSLVRKL